MAKRFPKQQGDDGDTIDHAPPDRPDQIRIGDADPEEISFLDDEGDKSDSDAQQQHADREPDEDRAPEVEPREERRRSEDDTALPESRDRDDDNRRRRAKGERDGEYSRDVRKRINREIALRKRTEARLTEERTARQQLEQRLTKLERVQVDEQGQASLREVDEKLRQAATELAEAKEAGDTKKEVELQIKIGELQAQKVQLQTRLDRERQERQDALRQTEERAGDDRAVAAPNKGRGTEWIRAQRRWWNTARWSGAHTDAITHDTTILAEIEDGELDFEPYSDEHLEELSRRLKTDYPDLEIRTLDGDVFESAGDEDYDDMDDHHDRRERMRGRDDDDEDLDQARSRGRNGNDRRRRAPMGGLGGRDGRRERSDVELARRGKITLSKDDFETMRVFKLDPSDPEHKKYFAKERARTLLRQANSGDSRR